MPGAVVARGDRVSLRTVEAEDAAFVQRGNANPELRYPLGAPVRSRGDVEGQDHIDGDHFLICLDNGDADTGRPDEEDADPGRPDEGDPQPIGAVTVTDASWRRPDLAYWIAPEHQGQGHGKAAVSLLVDYAFRTYEHPAVGATAYEFNDASRALLGSLGFEEEGRVRRDRFVDGEYVDTCHYGLLREAWEGE